MQYFQNLNSVYHNKYTSTFDFSMILDKPFISIKYLYCFAYHNNL